MKICYVLHAESHTKKCADYVLAMAMLRIVPIDVKHDHENGVIQWTFQTHKDVYDVINRASYMTPDL